MPYSEFQIKRHIEILDEKAAKEVEGTSEEPELTTLYMIVATQDEVEEHNEKTMREKIDANGMDLGIEKESEEEYHAPEEQIVYTKKQKP